MKKPNWQTKFKNLPEIPVEKRWEKGFTHTLEQRLSQKLIQGGKLTEIEKRTLSRCSLFYAVLYKSLENLDYKSFTLKDIKNFENYLFYAFNYNMYLTNKLGITRLFRVVINEHLTGNKNSITKKGLLTYPPLHVVKKINKFNRANTPRTSVFYGSETIDTALNEIKPEKGDIVTVGFWKPNVDREFLSYPISHSEKAYKINDNSTSAIKAFLEFKEKNSKVLGDFMEPYFHLFGREFSKPVEHHYEYLISSMFAERILYNQKNTGSSFEIECIVYPSVGNKFLTSNLAIRKDILRHNFDLEKVIEFEVTNTHFEREQKPNPESISLVDYTNLKETKNIDGNNIIW